MEVHRIGVLECVEEANNVLVLVKVGEEQDRPRLLRSKPFRRVRGHPFKRRKLAFLDTEMTDEEDRLGQSVTSQSRVRLTESNSLAPRLPCGWNVPRFQLTAGRRHFGRGRSYLLMNQRFSRRLEQPLFPFGGRGGSGPSLIRHLHMIMFHDRQGRRGERGRTLGGRRVALLDRLADALSTL